MARRRRRKVEEEKYRHEDALLDDAPPKEAPAAPKYKVTLAYLIDPQEVLKLVEATETPYPEVKLNDSVDYSTFTQPEVEALIAGTYHPKKFRKKK